MANDVVWTDEDGRLRSAKLDDRAIDPTPAAGQDNGAIEFLRTIRRYQALGTPADSANLAALLATSGVKEVQIFGSASITTHLISPVGSRIVVAKGATLTVAAGIVADFTAGDFDAPPVRVFFGVGQAIVSPDSRFDPRWWGRPSSFGGDATNLLHLCFNSPGAFATLRGLRGETVVVTRSTSAPVIVNGVEITATANQARVSDNGLLVEPAATNGFLDPTDFSTVNWTLGGLTIAAATDPLGGATAWAFMETAAASPHQVFQLIAIPASATSVSVYVRLVGRTRFRIASNGAVNFVTLNSTTRPGSFTIGGGTTRGETEFVGGPTGDWYRVTLYFATGTALIAFGLDDGSGTFNYAGDITKGMVLWHPQSEQNACATSWTSTTRDAEVVIVPYPNFGPEWAIELLAMPVGAQRWDRSAEDVLASIGTYTSSQSIEAYVNAGAAVCSVYDASAAELHQTSGALASVRGNYLGSRFLSFASASVSRPAVFIDGRGTPANTAGIGTGVFLGGVITFLRLASVSTGAKTGAFEFYEVRVTNAQRPPRRPVALSSYSWALPRGYVPRANCIAFLGDSNTEGQYDASIVTPYPQGAITTKGANYQPHNFGCGSTGTLQAVERWRADIRGRGYAKMVLFVGINDVNARIAAADIIANLTTIMVEASDDGVTVLPTTLMPTRSAPTNAVVTVVNAALAAYATAHGLTLLDAHAFTTDGGAPAAIKAPYAFGGGSLHLTQAGQTAWAAQVAASL